MMISNRSLLCLSLACFSTPLLAEEALIKNLTVITNPLGSAFGGVNLVLDAAVDDHWSVYIGSAYQDAKIFDTRMIGTGFKVGTIYYFNSYKEDTPYIRGYYGYGDFTAHTRDQLSQRNIGHFFSLLGGYEHVFKNNFTFGYGAGFGYEPHPKPLKIYDNGKERHVLLNAEGSHFSPNIEMNVGYRFY